MSAMDGFVGRKRKFEARDGGVLLGSEVGPVAKESTL